MKKNCLLWLLVAAMAMTSCQDEFIKNENKTSDKIGYAVEATSMASPKKARSNGAQRTKEVNIDRLDETLDGKPLYLHTVSSMEMPMDIKAEKKDTQNPQSRGSITATGDVQDIGVTSVVWNGTSWAAASDHRVYMDNILTEKPDFQTNYYWPAAEQYINFFAYSPKAAGAIEASNDKKTLTFDYTVPSTVTAQHDLLVASSKEPGNKKAEAPLKFCHALTAVQILISGEVQNVEVNEIVFNGIYNKGTYTYSPASDNGADEGDWELKGDTTTIGLKGLIVDPSTLAADVNGYKTINDGDNVFMMMPQPLTNGKLYIKLRNTQTGAIIPLIGDLSGKSWQKGYHVKYVISLNDESTEYIIEFADANDDGESLGTTLNIAAPYPYYGGFGNYSIRSYKMTTDMAGNVTYDKVAWQADLDNMVGVDYLTGEKGIGIEDPDDADATKTYEGVFQFGVVSNLSSRTHNMGIGGNSLYGNCRYDGDTYKETPVDLSRLSISNWNKIDRHTANCYVVRSPGYYRFPLVYGNGIKDEKVNTNAFSTNVSQPETFYGELYKISNSLPISTGNNASITGSVLTNFVDHYGGADNSAGGNDIVSPWIEEQCQAYGGDEYVITSAEIVWQDAPCLVTDVKIREFDADEEKTRKFICFQVPYDAICNGNAVIALKNKLGNVMWSWHIWVAPEGGAVSTKPIKNRRVLGNYTESDTDASNWTREESTFELMQAYLGFCPEETRTYTAREGVITFKQVDENGNDLGVGGTASITFDVEGESITYNDNCPTYQWGRKDPILPFYNDGSGMKDKRYYKNDRKVYAENGDASDFYSSSQGTKKVSWGIAYPEKMAHGVINSSAGTSVTGGNWCTDLYLNLWNANCNELPMFSYNSGVDAAEFHNEFNDIVAIPVVKTIYDPCPAGYELPRIDAFTGATFKGITTKPYINSYEGNGTFANGANILSQSIENTGSEYTSFSLGLDPEPMPTISTRKSVTTDETYFMKGYGHRGVKDDNPDTNDDDEKTTGSPAEYACYLNVITSGLTCLQWLDEHTSGDKVLPYELYSNRLCIIHGKADNSGGTLRPNSGSYMRLGFPIIPVKTGSNPIRTEVKVGGDINQWVDGDHIDVEF